MDLLRDAYTDTIKPYQDSELTVTRKWYRVGDDVPTLGMPSVFLSEFSEAFPYLERSAGFMWPSARETRRRLAPAGLTYDHVCGTAADFAGLGTFDPDRNVVYDANWIPICCGATDVCVTQICAQDPVNGHQAGQLWSYPVPHQVATDTTPAALDQWAQNQGDTSPASPGRLDAWFPGGRGAEMEYYREQVANAAGVVQHDESWIRFAADNHITRRDDSTGYTFGMEQGGASGTFTRRVTGGVLTLSGTNATIDPVLLPDFEPTPRMGVVSLPAAGTTYATAPTVDSMTIVTNFTSSAAGVRLPIIDAGGTPIQIIKGMPSIFRIRLDDSSFPTKLYPGAGATFWPFIIGGPPIVMQPGHAYILIATVPNRWAVFDVDGQGTVKTVGISTSSAGLTVGVADPTTTPALTVDLAPELDALLPVPALDGILACDGSANFAAVTIGAGLVYAGGTLSAPFVYPTSGRATWSTFAVTGASNVYQATGNTITLPAAGTYSIRAAVRGELQSGAVGVHFLKVKLRNNTTAADVTDSEVIITGVGTTTDYGMATAPIIARVVTTGAEVIELQAARVGTTFAVSQVQSDGNGRSVVEWERVG